MAVDNDKAGKDFIQTMKCFVDLKEDIPTNEKIGTMSGRNK